MFKIFLSSLILVLASIYNLFGQNQSYSSGTSVYNFTASGNLTGIPAGTLLKIECWGAGGGGGGASGDEYYKGRGSGGAGGSYSRLNSYNYTSGGTLSITVGSGGNGGSGFANGSVGGNSFVGSLCLAKGGGGGGGSDGFTYNNGGISSTSGNIGDQFYLGGHGYKGNSANSGGGGGGAGSSAVGTGGNSTGTTTGQPGGAGGVGNPSTGNGGNGANVLANGSSGNVYGGGGGGARTETNAFGVSRTGGTGANGYVRITIVPSCSVSAASSSPTLCVNTPMTSITHTTTGVSGITSSSGLPTGVTASYASNTITISGTPSVSGTFFNYTITPTGCATTATGTITVNPSVTTPTVITVSGTEPSCQLTSSGTTDYNSSATVGTLSWSLSGITNTTGTLLATAINSSTGVVTWPTGWSGSVTVNVVSTGCNGPSTAVTRVVTVNAIPSAPLYTAANITVGPIQNAGGTPLLADASITTNGDCCGSGHEGYRGRLFNMANGVALPAVRGWAGTGVAGNYWQVDLGSIKPVNGIITQGRGDLGCTVSCQQWCTTYEVQISTDNVNWTSLGKFNGNTNETTPVTNMFVNMTTNGRYVRVYPLTGNNHAVMRIDIISIPSPLCAAGAQSVSMSAEPNSGANTIRWYASASGGAVLNTGQFYTASISATTNFYAASYNSTTGCESTARTLVTAQVGVAVGSQPTTISNVPAICSDFTSALPNGWKTDHQALVTPSASSTHDCSGLAASMNASGHYAWVRYNANATNVRYTLKLNNNAPTAIRYLLVEQSVDGCVWSPVTIHTNSSVATDESIVEFTGTLNAASRHVRFNMTRRDTGGGKIELDNVIVYNGSLPAVSLAPSGSSKTCRVYGNHWVNFYTASNELIGSVKANGALNGSTNDLGDVTLTVNVGAAGSMFACNTGNNPLYETAYMGRNWTVSSTNFPNSANFAANVSFRAPYATTELTALNAAATSTSGNLNDNGASASNMMLTKISGGTPVNFSPTDNCGNGTITGIAQSGNGALTAAYPTMSSAGSYVDFLVGQFSEMFLHKNYNVSPLPVTLTAFGATCSTHGEVEVNWQTASELNSSHFVIERSRDLVTWNVVSTLPAGGNTTMEQVYAFTDEDAMGGISYYRLVQVDFNGDSEIYGPISVTCESTESNSMTIFPNPTKGDFTVEVTSDQAATNATLQLTDLTGKIIVSRKVDLVAGKNQLLFSDLDLQLGTYIVRIQAELDIKPVKLVVD